MKDAVPVDILIVEDNEDDVVMIKLAIEKIRLINIIHIANNSEEAMKFLRKEDPCQDARIPGLVLLDINIPIHSGFEILREIKDDPKLKSIPVIMLTTSDRDEDVVRSFSDGACSFIPKPVDAESLFEVLKQFSIYWGLVAKVPPKLI